MGIFEANSHQSLKDKSGVAVWLVPMDGLQNSGAEVRRSHYRMTERNKMFEPHLLVVPSGSIVDFPNLDPWFHSAFSMGESRPFDLGQYGSRGRKYVKFDRAGATYVFCKIHPQMAAVVLAVDSLYFGVSDKAGHISIRNVPPGKYQLQVWYEDAPRRALEALQRPVLVVEDKCELPTISVAVVKRSTAKPAKAEGETHGADRRLSRKLLGPPTKAVAG